MGGMPQQSGTRKKKRSILARLKVQWPAQGAVVGTQCVQCVCVSRPSSSIAHVQEPKLSPHCRSGECSSVWLDSASEDAEEVEEVDSSSFPLLVAFPESVPDDARLL